VRGRGRRTFGASCPAFGIALRGRRLSRAPSGRGQLDARNLHALTDVSPELVTLARRQRQRERRHTGCGLRLASGSDRIWNRPAAAARGPRAWNHRERLALPDDGIDQGQQIVALTPWRERRTGVSLPDEASEHRERFARGRRLREG
jgi:hypothetical protein